MDSARTPENHDAAHPSQGGPPGGAPADSPGTPTREFVGRGDRNRQVLSLVILGLIGGQQVIALQTDWNPAMAVFAGLLLLLAATNARAIWWPPRVRVGKDSLELQNAASPFRTTAENIRWITYDGGAMCLAFRDLSVVQASQPVREQCRQRMATDGCHVACSGLSPHQVAAIRATAGAAQPTADDPVRVVESFSRLLRAATPRVYMTRLLITLNVAVFVLMVLWGVSPQAPTAAELTAWGANFGPLTSSGQWWRLLTCMFLHFGFFHLLVNMWALQSAGEFVERLLGNVGFVVLYLVSGVMGSAVSLFFHPVQVSAGASGAIFGVFGALQGFTWRSHSQTPKVIYQRLRDSGISFLALNLAFGWLVPGIDLSAHIGGFVVGFLGGAILSQPLPDVTPAKRTVRNAGLGVIGVVALAVAITLAPRVPADQGRFVLAFEKLQSVEGRCVGTFNDAVQKLQRKEITPAEFAQTIQKQILPPWRALRQEFSDLQEAPPEFRRHLPLLKSYLQTREDAWQLTAQAALDDDPSLYEKVAQKNAEVKRLVDELKQTPL